jgi:hypothetical protein
VKVTTGNNAYTVDQGQTMDNWTTGLQMIMNHNNAAALQYHLMAIVRGNSVTITIPANSYLFGIEYGATASLASKWIDGKSEWQHDNYNRWLSNLSFNVDTAEI